MSSLVTESPPSPVLHVSETAYWQDYYALSDTAYEWNNGKLEKKPVSDYETYCIHIWFTKLLTFFLQTNPIAAITGLEMGFRLALTDKTVIRKPDLGVVLHSNPVALHRKHRSYHGIFDLCVESLSDSNKHEKEHDTVTKKAEYAAIGVKEYFILHHSAARAFYRLNQYGVYTPIMPQNGVIHSEVLPGFQFRISDLTKQPTEAMMVDDAVYRDFVLPAWTQVKEQQQIEASLRQAAEQRAQKAELQATEEASLRQAAEQKIAHLMALLAEREGN